MLSSGTEEIEVKTSYIARPQRVMNSALLLISLLSEATTISSFFFRKKIVWNLSMDSGILFHFVSICIDGETMKWC